MMVMDAEKVLRRFESLENKRGEWEGRWQQCSDYVLPRMGQNNKENQHIFDSTATMALERFVSAMSSILTPGSQKWHDLITGSPLLDKDPAVVAWLERLRNLLFDMRYAPEANFTNQIIEAYNSLGVFGTAVIFIDEPIPGLGPRYKNIPLYETYLAENAAGRIDTVFRKYELTAAQALEEFGEELPEAIKKDAEDERNMDKKYEFIHGVFPRKRFDRNRNDSLNMPFASVHIAKSGRKVVRESGYHVMPYAVSRFYLTSGEVYGRSPAMEVMPNIVQVNAMKKTILRAAEKMVNPPLMVPEDDILAAFNLKAGAINPGAVDSQGRQLVVPLEIKGNLPVGLEMITQEQKAINDAFFVTLFQVLVEEKTQTATEAMLRDQEKAQLLFPTMGRQQSELLRSIIEIELSIVVANEDIGPAPVPQGFIEVQPKYTTPMMAALSGNDGQAVLSALEAIAGMSQFDPGVIDLIDYEKAADAVMRSLNVPSDVRRPDSEVQEIRQQRAQAEQQAAMEQQAAQTLAASESLSKTNLAIEQANALGAEAVGSA